METLCELHHEEKHKTRERLTLLLAQYEAAFGLEELFGFIKGRLLADGHQVEESTAIALGHPDEIDGVAFTLLRPTRLFFAAFRFLWTDEKPMTGEKLKAISELMKQLESGSPKPEVP